MGIGDREGAWVQMHFEDEDGVAYRYATSLHWSVTQFTPASMEVSATNLSERIYSVVTILCAMVVFSTFISSITEAMTHLRKVNSRRDEEYAVLRAYFTENKVSMELG